jgi:predicted RNA polymerase sigma factor
VVQLNHAVAVGMDHGPQEGLGLIKQLQTEPKLAEDYRLYSVRAHLQEIAGHVARARESYLAAAERAPNLAQQRYLHAALPVCQADAGTPAVCPCCWLI